MIGNAAMIKWKLFRECLKHAARGSMHLYRLELLLSIHRRNRITLIHDTLFKFLNKL